MERYTNAFCKVPLVSTKIPLPRKPKTKADLLPSREGERVTFCTSEQGGARTAKRAQGSQEDAE